MHNIFTEQINKILLHSNEDKRMLMMIQWGDNSFSSGFEQNITILVYVTSTSTDAKLHLFSIPYIVL